MQHAKRLLALLYATADPLPRERIKTLLQLSEQSLHQALQDAEALLTGLPFTLHEEAAGIRLILRQDYADIAQLVNPETDLSRQALDILALIAYTQPLLQSELTRIMGNVYDVLKHLEDRGFIIRQKHGRSYEIRLGKAFYTYFEVPEGDEKDLLEQIARERGITLTHSPNAAPDHTESDNQERKDHSGRTPPQEHAFELGAHTSERDNP